MLDQLNRKKPWHTETGIVNLDTSDGPGTHWIAYSRKGSISRCYNSFGDLEPPIQLKNYLGSSIFYNFEQDQKAGTSVCGHLALKFLIKETQQPKFLCQHE